MTAARRAPTGPAPKRQSPAPPSQRVGTARRSSPSPRVLRLLADGLRNEEIGRRLHISPDTVRAHVRKAMGRLDADTRTEAVATALRQQLIS